MCRGKIRIVQRWQWIIEQEQWDEYLRVSSILETSLDFEIYRIPRRSEFHGKTLRNGNRERVWLASLRSEAKSERKTWLVNWNRWRTWRLLGSSGGIDEFAADVVNLRPVSSSVSRSSLETFSLPWRLFIQRQREATQSRRCRSVVVSDGTRRIPLTLKDSVTRK